MPSCPTCGKGFPASRGVNLHLKRLHGVPSELVRSVIVAGPSRPEAERGP